MSVDRERKIVELQDVPEGMPFAFHDTPDEAWVHLGDGQICSPCRTRRNCHTLNERVEELPTTLHSHSMDLFSIAEILRLADEYAVDTPVAHHRKPECRQGDCAIILHAIAKLALDY